MSFGRYLAVTGATWLIAATAVAGFNLLVDPIGISPIRIVIAGFNERKPLRQDYDWIVKRYDVWRGQPTTIFMGSSRIKQSVDPKPTAGTAFAPAYNGGINGSANFEEIKSYLQYYLSRDKNLRHVFIEAFAPVLLTMPKAPSLAKARPLAKVGIGRDIADFASVFFSVGGVSSAIRTIWVNREQAIAVKPPTYASGPQTRRIRIGDKEFIEFGNRMVPVEAGFAGAVENAQPGEGIAGPEGNSVAFSGWAIDAKGRRGPDEVLFFVGDTLWGSINVNVDRPDIVAGFGPAYIRSGFDGALTGVPLAKQKNVRAFVVLSDATARELQYSAGYPFTSADGPGTESLRARSPSIHVHDDKNAVSSDVPGEGQELSWSDDGFAPIPLAQHHFSVRNVFNFVLHTGFLQRGGAVSQLTTAAAREMIEDCKLRQVGCRFFVSPLHADVLYAAYYLGLWPQLEKLKRTFAGLAPTYDFTRYNGLIEERIGPVVYWPEAFHFSPALGALVVKAMTGLRTPDMPENFGAVLDANNIESSLAAWRQERDQWIAQHPDAEERMRKTEENFWNGVSFKAVTDAEIAAGGW